MRRIAATLVVALTAVLLPSLGQDGAGAPWVGGAGSWLSASSGSTAELANVSAGTRGTTREAANAADPREIVTTTPPAGGIAGTTATVAATVGLKAVSHNICGGMCMKGQTSSLPAITDLIDAYRPHLLMLQEVCFPQYEWFSNHAFSSGTYQLGFTTLLTNYTGCGVTNCAVNEDDDPTNDDRRCWIGQVVGARGTLSNRDEIALGGERYQINGSEFVNPPRTFTGLCYDAHVAELGTRVVKGCSVHLRAFHDPRNINQRARTAQATRLASDLDGDIASGKIVVVGGDFNSLPTHVAMDAFYRPETKPGGGWGVFYEADQDDKNYFVNAGCASTAAACRSGGRTVGTKTKYDYLFFSETTDPSSVSGLPVDVTVSDHAFYRGFIQVATS
ncbi:Endonuclease/Exonuclease/phosphatase family protein [Micromonospora citrea]|uniref:Endonuclease/Exonuclease/phosphatase family protein n=1 Tax=Micromonospora citrea TaxID=47855 RepID=A0A1C6TTE2_9ACTN|nr:endonuclease/exonuclease/phosphatase family protein [Micromonospora citrea]SCL45040.1 Endonuclease/Exonuclease/phosphatase family protein [Micromonospora citrea]